MRVKGALELQREQFVSAAHERLQQCKDMQFFDCCAGPRRSSRLCATENAAVIVAAGSDVTIVELALWD
ncbi:MAG: hypothetical protein DWH96_09060 [Planctomycetota bacterium]|nr:MAG: hypothetical protein DWH96_09060 [Planctomycetota bacterium]